MRSRPHRPPACRAPSAEQLHAGHLEAHPAVCQTNGAVRPGQPCGEDIRLRQTGGDQAKRLAVNFAAFANGADVRRGGLHLAVHHDAARAANAAGLRQTALGCTPVASTTRAAVTLRPFSSVTLFPSIAAMPEASSQRTPRAASASSSSTPAC
jgi:hypothetical protein